VARELKITTPLCAGVSSPIGISPAEMPMFSWTLVHESADAVQETARVTVYIKNGTKHGEEIWDSGVTYTDIQSMIYSGPALHPRTSYRFKIECTDTKGASAHAESSFETALGVCVPGAPFSVWEGADAVYRPEKNFFTSSMESFSYEATVRLKRHSKRAGLVFGASGGSPDDSHSENTESYFLLSLDASDDGPAVKIYRYGFSSSDKKEIPLYTIRSKEKEVLPQGIDPQSEFISADISDVLTKDNVFDAHRIKIHSQRGAVAIMIDGTYICRFDDGLNLTGMNSGAKKDVSFTASLPTLSSVGFFVGENDTAFFSDVTINDEYPIPVYSDGIFAKDIKNGKMGISSDGYRLFGGKSGKIIYADPSCSNITLFRTEHVISSFGDTSSLPASARLYVGATCDYDLYCCGERLTNIPVSYCGADNVYFYKVFQLDDIVSSNSEISLGFALFEGICRSDICGLITLLSVRYSDGTEKLFPSSCDSFKFMLSSIFTRKGNRGGILNYSESKLLSEFSIPGFDDDKWKTPSDHIKRSSDISFIPEPYAKTDSKKITPKLCTEISSPSGNRYIYDAGGCISGFIRLSLPLKKSIFVRLYTEKYLEEPAEKKTDMCELNVIPGNEIASFTFVQNAGEKDKKLFIEDTVCETRFSVCTFRFIEIITSGEAVASEKTEVIPVTAVSSSSSFVCDDKNLNKLFKNALKTVTSSFLTIPAKEPLGTLEPIESIYGCCGILFGASALCDCTPLLKKALVLAEQKNDNVFVIQKISYLLYTLSRDKRALEKALSTLEYVTSVSGELMGDAEDTAILFPNRAIRRYAELAEGLTFSVRLCKQYKKEYLKEISDALKDLKKSFTEFFRSDMLSEYRAKNELDNFYAYAAPLHSGLFENEFSAAKRLSELTYSFADDITRAFPDTETSALICKVLFEKNLETASETVLRCEKPSMWMDHIRRGSTVLRDHRQTGSAFNLISECSCESLTVIEHIVRNLLGISIGETNGSFINYRISPSLNAFSRVKASFDTIYGNIELGWSSKASVTKFILEVPQCSSVSLEFSDLKDLRILNDNGGIADKAHVHVSGRVCTLELSSGKYDIQLMM